MRTQTTKDIETDILIQSGRRCCLCYGIHSDFIPKKGQIAHIDHNPLNSTYENLAFLCLQHHDEYDSKTSQSKGFTNAELKAYRQRLYQKIQEVLTPTENLRAFIDQIEVEEVLVTEAVDKILADAT